jgi:predicted methyltransferase
MSEASALRLKMNNILKSCLKNDSIQEVLTLGPQEQNKYLAYLLEHNNHHNEDGSVNDEGSDKVFDWRVIHRYFQLPCDTGTQHRRADWFESKGWRESSILLLGDDDLVSIELARRGFERVHVVDCDRKVLAQIDHETKALQHKPNIIEADLASPNLNLEGPIDVICLDPPYNLVGARMFLRAAFDVAEETSDCELVMMINPLCFTQTRWQTLMNLIRQHGFELITHQPHFNSYPIFGINRIALRAAIYLLIGKHLEGDKGKLSFGSDLFHFSKSSR